MKNLKEEIQSAVNIFKSGNLSKAEKVCKKLIVANPNLAFLYNLLGLIMAGSNKFDEAVKYYEKGLKIDPKFALIYNNLGLLFFHNRTSGNINKAEEFYKKSISINDNNSEPYINLGTLYSARGNYKDAEDCYKKSISINPKSSFAHFNLGTLLITIGKFDDARKYLEESIDLNPGLIASHRALSRITKYTINDKHFIELKKLYEKSSPKDLATSGSFLNNSSPFRSSLCFSLGKAYEDIGDYDKSFQFYKEANSLHRKNINFSLEDESKIFTSIKNTFNKKIFDKFTNSESESKNFIFIVGMPRSGTTLVEQILSSHPKVFGADEVETVPFLIAKYFRNQKSIYMFKDIINFDDEMFKKIGREYISRMRDYSNNSEYVTDKLPINFLAIGFIKLILPNAKIVHCSRNSKDNILSIYKNNFTSNRVGFAYDLREIVEYYNQYFDLMKYWNNLLPRFVYEVNYEKLISNTKNEIVNLLKFCDLEWSNNCLEFYRNKRPIKTASDTQVRNKIYKTSVDSWKNYEDNLKKYFIKLKS